MKHLMTLMALVVAVTAGAQVKDTIFFGNEVHFNLNYDKVDSMLDRNAYLEATSSCDLRGADFNGANLSGVDLTRANIDGASLRGSNFTGANLTGAVLTGQLQETNFTGANLTDAVLAGLYQANLTGANLTGTEVHSGTESNFTGANLTNADFSFADLFNADFSDAIFTGVTWRGAYIEGCIGCPCTDADNNNICDNLNCLEDTDGDGWCDEEEISGCLDFDACNFFWRNTDHDESFCIYAAAGDDCDCDNGDCLVDTDGVAISDENEISGCLDPTACNFFSGYTDHDESNCLYADFVGDDCFIGF